MSSPVKTISPEQEHIIQVQKDTVQVFKKIRETTPELTLDWIVLHLGRILGRLDNLELEHLPPREIKGVSHMV
jgi:hypothetical protein